MYIINIKGFKIYISLDNNYNPKYYKDLFKIFSFSYSFQHVYCKDLKPIPYLQNFMKLDYYYLVTKKINYSKPKAMILKNMVGFYISYIKSPS